MKPKKIEMPSAIGLACAINEHIERLRPSVTPTPKKKEISACRATATGVNSIMNIVRTSLQVTKVTEAKPKMAFMNLE